MVGEVSAIVLLGGVVWRESGECISGTCDWLYVSLGLSFCCVPFRFDVYVWDGMVYHPHHKIKFSFSISQSS